MAPQLKETGSPGTPRFRGSVLPYQQEGLGKRGIGEIEPEPAAASQGFHALPLQPHPAVLSGFPNLRRRVPAGVLHHEPHTADKGCNDHRDHKTLDKRGAPGTTAGGEDTPVTVPGVWATPPA